MAAVCVNPFNNEHDGANCLRCGYRVDDARASWRADDLRGLRLIDSPQIRPES